MFANKTCQCLRILVMLLQSLSSCFGINVSEKEFDNALVKNGYESPTKAQYKAFMSQLNTPVQYQHHITTKREAAMFLSQIIWESGGLTKKVEENPGKYKDKMDVPGREYYGRGYIQLVSALSRMQHIYSLVNFPFQKHHDRHGPTTTPLLVKTCILMNNFYYTILIS